MNIIIIIGYIINRYFSSLKDGLVRINIIWRSSIKLGNITTGILDSGTSCLVLSQSKHELKLIYLFFK